MYLMINGNKHTVSRRIVKPNEIRYLSVTPAPEEVSGMIQMYDDGQKVAIPEEETEAIETEAIEGEVTEDGITETEVIEGEVIEEVPEPEVEYTDFLISEDNADNFARWKYSGTLLILTNVPEPVPTPAPKPTEATTFDMAQAILEGVNEV